MLTAYREFFEEVGLNMDYSLKPFLMFPSAILYPNGDLAYGDSYFYLAFIDANSAARFGNGSSSEGKFSLLKQSELKEHAWFSNHVEALQAVVDGNFEPDQSFTHYFRQLCQELGLPEGPVAEFINSGSKNITSFFEDHGVTEYDYESIIREKTGQDGLVLPQGDLLIVTKTPDGEPAFLVQRKAGTPNLRFAGSSVKVWYHGEIGALESTALRAYSVLYENVGLDCDVQLNFLLESTATVYEPESGLFFRGSYFFETLVDYDSVAHLVNEDSPNAEYFFVKQSNLGKYSWDESHKVALQAAIEGKFVD